jgi:hypothetical protein
MTLAALRRNGNKLYCMDNPAVVPVGFFDIVPNNCSFNR